MRDMPHPHQISIARQLGSGGYGGYGGYGRGYHGVLHVCCVYAVCLCGDTLHPPGHNLTATNMIRAACTSDA